MAGEEPGRAVGLEPGHVAMPARVGVQCLSFEVKASNWRRGDRSLRAAVSCAIQWLAAGGLHRLSSINDEERGAA
jgi:hypothetical protein